MANNPLQLRSLTGVAADAYLWAQSLVVSGLHFAGIVKPNPEAQKSTGAAGQQACEGGSSSSNSYGGASAGEAAAATAETAKAAMHDPSVIKTAIEGVAQNMAQAAKVRPDGCLLGTVCLARISICLNACWLLLMSGKENTGSAGTESPHPDTG